MGWIERLSDKYGSSSKRSLRAIQWIMGYRARLSCSQRHTGIATDVSFTAKRIEAHVCICFVAYKVYKELERILRLSGINLSVDKVLNIAKNNHIENQITCQRRNINQDYVANSKA